MRSSASAKSSPSRASESEFLGHEADLPFAVIADPDRRLYVEFGGREPLVVKESAGIN
jgi:hypothetical protein